MGKTRTVKALIVDDDQIVLDSCRRVLEAEGFEVSLVPGAEKALEVLGKNSAFDLLLIDVKMPGKDGMYLIRKVKGSWPAISIILMSGYPTMETIAEGLHLGAAKFIAKPFTPDELIEIVHQVLQKGSMP
jgi:DNA-binding NtrC family response regulator